LPARSLAQPRDSTRVVPAVPCCRSQPHCSSGSRGRDGKTAWALAAGCRWTPEASGRAAQRRARATGAPAPADRPALARGAWREGDGSSGERPSFKGRAGQGRDADAARWRSLGQAELHRLRSAVTPAAQRSVRISVAGQFPPHLCVSHHQEGRGEPPAAVPRGDAAAPRGARHHSSCARPSVTSRLTQSLPRLPSAAASCSRTARPMDTAP
ncbi:unnamed protein product, partial [Prorocentrum cordatum]